MKSLLRPLWRSYRDRRIKRRLKSEATALEELPAGSFVFFAPEAYITPHFRAMVLLAKCLKDKGHPVYFTRCFRDLPRCPAKTAECSTHGQEQPPEFICRECYRHSSQILAEHDIPFLSLQSLLDKQDQSQIAQAMASAPADLRHFELDGVKFGLIAAGDLILERKISDFDRVSALDRQIWLSFIGGSLTAYLATRTLCLTGKVRAIAHFNDYGPLLSARIAAKKLGVAAHAISFAYHLGSDRRRLTISPVPWLESYPQQGLAWPKWKPLALPPRTVKEISQDLLSNIEGKHVLVYSPAKQGSGEALMAELGLSPEKQTLVAYTSSLDERIAITFSEQALGISDAGVVRPFKNQIQWLQALTGFVASRNDLQLVVRIHPREGKTRRENISSQHLVRLKEAFESVPANVFFIWPDSKVSSYDLAEVADLALTSWSNIALELARMAIPVLSTTRERFTAYPCENFIRWAPDEASYFGLLDQLLKGSHSADLNAVVHAYRWYYLSRLGTAIDFSDVVEDSFAEQPPCLATPKNADQVEQVFASGLWTLDLNHADLKQAQHAGAAHEEKQAVLLELTRLLRHFINSNSSALTDVSQCTYQGRYVLYPQGQKLAKKFSPTGARIVRLLREHLTETDQSHVVRREVASL